VRAKKKLKKEKPVNIFLKQWGKTPRVTSMDLRGHRTTEFPVKVKEPTLMDHYRNPDKTHEAIKSLKVKSKKPPK